MPLIQTVVCRELSARLELLILVRSQEFLDFMGSSQHVRELYGLCVSGSTSSVLRDLPFGQWERDSHLPW